jgi:phage baseplate assembly protein V
MSVLTNLLRRVRIRGLVEGLVQRANILGLPNEARDSVERHQDYGFAANPVEGEGLRIEVGGHTIILRMDKTESRPQLAAHEVCVWHKDGHKVTLKAGGKVQVDCTEFIINASSKVEINSPTTTGTGNATFGGTVTGTVDVIAAGKSGKNHVHSGIQPGASNTGGPV